jgi:hypothetical protein
LSSKAASSTFAFVDGNHRFERVFLDLIYIGRLVRPGAIVGTSTQDDTRPYSHFVDF